ncbi:MAG TPA: RnfH family protein [Rubrivivax sp.]|nr:RnfH family protein [Rubrivivax sp.]
MARAEATLQVEVVYCVAPGQTDRVVLRLPEGACLQDAVEASGVCARHALDLPTLKVGIWGRVQPPQTPLRDRDRVELYRPLRVDPKEARRLRYKRARQQAAG